MTASGVIFLNSGDYFATPPTNNPLLNTWPLSVQEQLYLVFPALPVGQWWLSRKLKGGGERTRIQILGLLVVGAASFALNVILSFELVSFRFSDPNWSPFIPHQRGLGNLPLGESRISR